MLVGSLGQEDSLKEEMATTPVVLAWRIPWTEEPGQRIPWQSHAVHGVAKSQT